MGITPSARLEEPAEVDDLALYEQAFIQEQYSTLLFGGAPQDTNAPARPAPVVSNAQVVRNPVSLTKDTIVLAKEHGPGARPHGYALEFSFDSTTWCAISVYCCATETVNADRMTTKIKCRKPDRNKPFRLVFPPGTKQKFSVSEHKEQTLDLSVYTPPELKYNAATGEYPLIIMLQSLTEAAVRELPPVSEAPSEFSSADMNAATQFTYVSLSAGDTGMYSARAVVQKLQIMGRAYELKELFGSALASGTEGDCVICMSDKRNTTVLPCRHLCLCRGCADTLRTQTNKCPICRANVMSLLHIDSETSEV